MIINENCDEETARENKAMCKRHALNQDRCHQPYENSFDTSSFLLNLLIFNNTCDIMKVWKIKKKKKYIMG